MSENFSIRGLFVNDWPRKLSAIILAILIYSTVRIQLQQERTFSDVLVKVVPDNPKLVVLDNEPIYVSVTLEGTKRVLKGLKSNQQIQIMHRIDAMTEPGPYTCILDPNDVKLPPGVKLADTNPFLPERFQVELDRVIETKVDVRVIINRDTVPEGWAVKNPKANPRKVKVVGPRRYLEKLYYVKTSDIDIVQRLDKPESFNQSVRLEKPAGALSVEPIAVDVNIDFEQNTVLKGFRDVPVKVLRRTDQNLEIVKYIDPPKVSFAIQGESDDVDYLDLNSFEPFIILDDTVSEGETIRTIYIWFDRNNRDSCIITDKNPESLRVVIGKSEEPKVSPPN